jgi:four helix bundle protein
MTTFHAVDSSPVKTSSPDSPVGEITGTPRLPFQRLDCYAVARELARRVHAAGISDAELRDQATRASKSAFLNLCEGLPSDRPAIRRRYFLCADGSLHETAGAVDLAAAIGAIDASEAAELLALAVRLRAMLRGLLGPTGRAR